MENRSFFIISVKKTPKYNKLNSLLIINNKN